MFAIKGHGITSSSNNIQGGGGGGECNFRSVKTSWL